MTLPMRILLSLVSLVYFMKIYRKQLSLCLHRTYTPRFREFIVRDVFKDTPILSETVLYCHCFEGWNVPQRHGSWNVTTCDRLRRIESSALMFGSWRDISCQLDGERILSSGRPRYQRYPF
jgi:hypothetical protein